MRFPTITDDPSNFAILETLIGHTFVCKRLLLEAVTHPSHLSVPSTPSYQGLEYLGDAILDYLVTTTVFSYGDRSQKALQAQRMHTFPATAVNASFLAFCSLSGTISIPIVEIASPDSTRRLCSFPAGGQYASIPSICAYFCSSFPPSMLHAIALQPLNRPSMPRSVTALSTHGKLSRHSRRKKFSAT